jgi:hypothetical protein
MSPVQGFDPASSLGDLGAAVSGWTLPLILTEPKKHPNCIPNCFNHFNFFSNTASHIACSRAMADRKGGVKGTQE